MNSLIENSVLHVRKLLYTIHFNDIDHAPTTATSRDCENQYDSYDIYVRSVFKNNLVLERKYYDIVYKLINSTISHTINYDDQTYDNDIKSLLEVTTRFHRHYITSLSRKKKSSIDSIEQMYSQIIKDITTELINDENVVIDVDDLCLIDYDDNKDDDSDNDSDSDDEDEDSRYENSGKYSSNIFSVYFKAHNTIGIDIKLVKWMIAKGVDINYKNEYGSGILHTYLGNMYVDTDVLELLCRSGKNINEQNNHLITPLHSYLRRDESISASVLKKVIELGADRNLRCCMKLTPIMTYIIYNAMNIDEEIIKIYMDDNKITNIPEILYLYIQMAQYVDIDVVKHFLKNGVILDYKDSVGRTCLHNYMLRTYINIDIVKLLLEHGNYLNEVDDFGNTVLHTYLSRLCIVNKNLTYDSSINNNINIEVVKYLIRSGSDISLVNNLGYTPLTSYICTAQNYMYHDIIDCLMSDKVLNMVKHRIIQDLITRKDISLRIIHHVITKYNIPVDSYTDEYKKCNYKTNDAYHFRMIKYYNNNILPFSGMTAFHVAVCIRNDVIMKYLLSIGYSIDKPTIKGLTALMLIFRRDRYTNCHIVKMLLDNRPSIDNIIIFLDKCYKNESLFSLCSTKNTNLYGMMALAFMLIGVNNCNKFIERIKHDLETQNTTNYRSLSHTLDVLVDIRDNISLLMSTHINNYSTISIYDILISRTYNIDITSCIEICKMYTSDKYAFYDIINGYIDNAIKTNSIVKDIIYYLRTYPDMCIPTSLLRNCIIDMYDLSGFRETLKRNTSAILPTLNHLN
ncbi:ankyrin repeat-containing protein [Cowpox virus]|uniref:Ankyrin repeat-containing protein n=1 Tax=Cowpox virus TaxID=10243 RepID=G0XXG7_COWPX|nr:ankyrin repeat-containing protein [Cowpox virus]